MKKPAVVAGSALAALALYAIVATKSVAVAVTEPASAVTGVEDAILDLVEQGELEAARIHLNQGRRDSNELRQIEDLIASRSGAARQLLEGARASLQHGELAEAGRKLALAAEYDVSTRAAPEHLERARLAQQAEAHIERAGACLRQRDFSCASRALESAYQYDRYGEALTYWAFVVHDWRQQWTGVGLPSRSQTTPKKELQ